MPKTVHELAWALGNEMRLAKRKKEEAGKAIEDRLDNNVLQFFEQRSAPIRMEADEYEDLVEKFGEHASEIRRRLLAARLEGRTLIVDDALLELTREAGDEAGESFDGTNLAFQNKHFWPKDVAQQHRDEFNATHPRKKKKGLSKKKLGERGSRDFARYMAESPEGDEISHTLFEDTLD